jgi:hypothetical protein
MSEHRRGGGGCHARRRVLQSAAGAIVAAVAAALRPETASAIIKISKTAVAYQDHPDSDDRRCGKCRQFLAPDSCKLVDGEISPRGYCRIFSPLT